MSSSMDNLDKMGCSTTTITATSTTANKSNIEITPEMTEQLLLKLLLQQINLDKQKESTTTIGSSTTARSADEVADISSNTDSSSTHYSGKKSQKLATGGQQFKNGSNNKSSPSSSSTSSSTMSNQPISKLVNSIETKSTSSMGTSSKLMQKSMSNFGPVDSAPPGTDYENPDENYYSSPSSRDTNKYFNYHPNTTTYTDTSSASNLSSNKFYKNRYY